MDSGIYASGIYACPFVLSARASGLSDLQEDLINFADGVMFVGELFELVKYGKDVFSPRHFLEMAARNQNLSAGD